MNSRLLGEISSTVRPLGGFHFLESLMLILTRRVGETLVIGDHVSVTVLGIKGNQIRIGITAPKDVSVHREEVFVRIQGEHNEDMPAVESGAK